VVIDFTKYAFRKKSMIYFVYVIFYFLLEFKNYVCLYRHVVYTMISRFKWLAIATESAHVFSYDMCITLKIILLSNMWVVEISKNINMSSFLLKNGDNLQFLNNVIYCYLLKPGFSSLVYIRPYPILAILFGTFGFLSPKDLNYLSFKSFDIVPVSRHAY